MGQESRSGRSLKAKHINGWQGREDQRHDTPLVDCLAKLPPAGSVRSGWLIMDSPEPRSGYLTAVASERGSSC